MRVVFNTLNIIIMFQTEDHYDLVKYWKEQEQTFPIFLGDSIIETIGYDEDGFPVAYLHRCTKQNCNCVGKWWQGNRGEIRKTIDL